MPEILPVNWLPDGRLPASSSAAVQRAADILTRGGLVAIPTETVYGLAALATDAGFSIYEGHEMACRVTHTLSRGSFVVRDGALQDNTVGAGRFVARTLGQGG